KSPIIRRRYLPPMPMPAATTTSATRTTTELPRSAPRPWCAGSRSRIASAAVSARRYKSASTTSRGCDRRSIAAAGLAIFRPQVGTALAGEPLGLGAPPGRDLGVIAGDEHVRDRAAFEQLRSRIV